MKKNGFSWMKTITAITLIGCLFFSLRAAFAKDDIVLPGVPEVGLGEKNSLEMLGLISEIKAKTEEEPENYEYYSMLAFAYDYVGMGKESLEALKKELECYSGPDLHVLYYNIARAHINMGQMEEGKAYLDKAMDYRPDDIWNNVLLMEYSILVKDYRQAAKGMKKLVELVPFTDWYYDTFLKFYERADSDEYDFTALSKEALKENPNNHFAIRAEALTRRNFDKENFTENFPQIIKDLKRAYKLKPDYVFHCIGIGNTYLWKWAIDKDKKNLRQALKWMKKAQKLEPENPKVLYGLGHLYLYMREDDKAIKLLEKAITIGLDVDETVKEVLAQAYNGKAYSYYKKGKKLDEGMQLIEKALIFDPEDVWFLSTKAELLYALGRYEEAHEYIKKAIAIEPGYEEMQQDLENIEKAMEGKKLE